jgi:hypothetical protein
MSAAADLVQGAVDLYVHSSPDPIPRKFDDIALARHLSDQGIAAVLHRHHSCSTVERAELVRAVTGFRMWGAVEISGPAGGLEPVLVEVGLRQGAKAVALPMLSGSGFRTDRAAVPFEIGEVPVVDGDGKLLPAVTEIMELTRDAGALLIVGYLLPDEVVAAVNRASELGVERVMLCNPVGRGYRLDPDLVEELAADHDLVVELSIYQLDTFGPKPGPSWWDEGVALIHALGPGRIVVSSDGGAATSPPPDDLLRWGCERLLEAGFGPDEIRRMTRDNPASLLA